jgi:hypothetical protein
MASSQTFPHRSEVILRGFPLPLRGRTSRSKAERQMVGAFVFATRTLSGRLLG